MYTLTRITFSWAANRTNICQDLIRTTQLVPVEPTTCWIANTIKVGWTVLERHRVSPSLKPRPFRVPTPTAIKAITSRWWRVQWRRFVRSWSRFPPGRDLDPFSRSPHPTEPQSRCAFEFWTINYLFNLIIYIVLGCRPGRIISWKRDHGAILTRRRC
jgi:hypothetical protein